VDITGDVLIDNAGVTAINTGVIVNADVSGSAGIDFSKLAALASARILVGSAGNVATAVDVTGDVTISNAGVTAIGPNKVTLAMMAQIDTARFLGRTTASTGNVESLTVTQATALLNNFVGDSGAGGTKGLVPAPAAGDAAALKFLKADGTWATPTGAGDVVGPASSVASEIVLFDGTTGKLVKSATGTGPVKATSGVYSTGAINLSGSEATGTLAAGRFPALTGDITTSAGALATTAAATQANIQTLSRTAGVAVHGTNTNDSAAAGYVGEYVESAVSSVSASTSGTSNVTSISLTAGDWDVIGILVINKVTSTPNSTNWIGAISLNSAALTGCVLGQSQSQTPVLSVNNSTVTLPTYRRVSVSGTTTVYLVVNATSSGSAASCDGSLSARRVR
jgi:hypothetical protein